MNRAVMGNLLLAIYELRMHTYRLLQYSEQTKPGPPATEAQLRTVETTFRITLPPSYRLFLSIHNGWEHWSGDVALLSTEQMLTGEYVERVKEWKERNGASSPIIGSSFVIGFSLFTGEQILLDFSTPGGQVVVWDNRETERHADFYDYLLNFQQVLREELAELS